MKNMLPPDFENLSDYYKGYWKYWEEKDLLTCLSKQSYTTLTWFNSIPEKLESHSYSEGKWMLKEVIGHLCDTERILSYRALCISRNEKVNLPSFDENSYITHSNFRNQTLKDIIEEWKSIRGATISLFSAIDDEMADRKGTANDTIVTARILLYFILVHERHHIQLMKDRYLTSAVTI